MPAIYHLTPASYYDAQPSDQPYIPKAFVQEGFIHCTSDLDLLVNVANAYFADLPEALLALEIDPIRLAAPLKFEPPAPPPDAPARSGYADPDQLFPHIYGPLNRRAIINCFALRRDKLGRWRLPTREV